MEDFEVRCSSCNSIVNEEPDILPVHRKPCPNCGALGRRLPAIVNETVNFNDHYLNRLERKDPKRTGKKKLRINSIEGDQINHDSGKWIYKEWWIDRDHIPPWYFEKITDIETGEVIHFCSEPLPEHIGHGSDKRKR